MFPDGEIRIDQSFEGTKFEPFQHDDVIERSEFTTSPWLGAGVTRSPLHWNSTLPLPDTFVLNVGDEGVFDGPVW